ncbi:glycosyltransferase [soil metagenome]
MLLLIRGLRAKGWDVALMLLHCEGVRLDQARADGIAIFDVRLPRMRPRWNPLPWFQLPFTLARSVKFIRAWKPDVIHAWLFWAHLWARIALMFLPRIAFITSRRQTVHAGPLTRIESWVNRRADAVVANSNAVAESILKLEKNLPRRRFVIHHGIDLGAIAGLRIANLRSEFPALAGAAQVAVIVANLLPAKGYPDLLRAWKVVADKHADARLLCVGADGGLGRELVQLCGKLGLEKHVIFAGARTDAVSLIEGADLCVLSSRDEGLSNSMLEYMACGKPMVITAVSGAREAVAHEETGFIVPPQNPKALAAAINALIEDPVMAARLGSNARERALEVFDKGKMIRAYERLYRSADLRIGAAIPASGDE